jgi:hypothetical protein
MKGDGMIAIHSRNIIIEKAKFFDPERVLM